MRPANTSLDDVNTNLSKLTCAVC